MSEADVSPSRTSTPIATPRTVGFLHRGHDWIRGSEQCLLDLVTNLDPARYRPFVVCEQPTLASMMRAHGVAVEQLDPLEDWGVAVPAARASIRRRVRRLLREHGVTLLHVNASALVPILLPIARAMQVPLVTHLHLPVTEEHRRLRELVHQSDLVVGVAEHVLSPLVADGVPAARLRVIHNAVDARRLSRGITGDLRSRFGIAPTAFVVASVGSLIERKGHDVTIRAVARARATGADIHFVLCGAGAEDEALRQLARAEGVEEFVHFLGFLETAGAVMREVADACVTSAREEAMPLNVLEAQWIGLPVIASDITAHRESLHAEAGVLVTPEDPDALAAAIASLSHDPHARARMTNAGRLHAAGRYSMSRYVAEFQRVYDTLLAQPGYTYGWARGSLWPRAYTRWLVRIVRNRLRLPTRR